MLYSSVYDFIGSSGFTAVSSLLCPFDFFSPYVSLFSPRFQGRGLDFIDWLARPRFSGFGWRSIALSL